MHIFVNTFKVMGDKPQTFFVDFGLPCSRLPAYYHGLAAILGKQGLHHLSRHRIEVRVLLLKTIDTCIGALNNSADIMILEGVSVEFRDEEVRIDCDKRVLHIGVNLAIKEPG